MKIYTLGDILKTEHLGDEKYVRVEEIERLKKALEELRELGKYCSGDVYEVASQALKGE